MTPTPAKRALRAIERVLWEDWDPIGVRARGGPSDEYDSYAPGVLGLVQLGAAEREIAAHLKRLEEELMRIEPTPDAHRRRAAARAQAAVRRDPTA
jgi:hypothetical protein